MSYKAGKMFIWSLGWIVVAALVWLNNGFAGEPAMFGLPQLAAALVGVYSIGIAWLSTLDLKFGSFGFVLVFLFTLSVFSLLSIVSMQALLGISSASVVAIR